MVFFFFFFFFDIEMVGDPTSDLAWNAASPLRDVMDIVDAVAARCESRQSVAISQQRTIGSSPH